MHQVFTSGIYVGITFNLGLVVEDIAARRGGFLPDAALPAVGRYTQGGLLMPEYYEIKIKGYLDQRWEEWFAGLKLTHLEGDETLLSGTLPDQAALHGLLEHVRDLNMTLISVTSGSSSKQDSDLESRK
jgi:hypothetical protein